MSKTTVLFAFFSLITCVFNSKSQELYSYSLIDSIAVKFDFGRTEILNLDSIHLRLEKVAVDSNCEMMINGYTDTVGAISHNEVLAQKRINQVLALINDFDIPVGPIFTNNFNEYRNNKDFIVDSLYRRVDILIYRYQLNVPLNKNYSLLIQFGGSSAFLLPESRPIVEEIAVVLQRDKSLNIELQGHISGNDPDYELSLKRALSVKDYLIELGIEEARITCKGMSNEFKRYTEYSEENRRLNRRVEIILTRSE